jgi:lysophospholipase L1-like esterase
MINPDESISLVPSRGFANQTIRQVLHLDGGGRQVRILLSNRYGKQPLVVGAASAAIRKAASRIVDETDINLRVQGAAEFEIPAGDEVVSNPVDLSVSAGTDLAVSLFLPQATDLATFTQNANETGYVTTGNAVSAHDLDGAEELTSRFYLAGVDVLARADTRIAVAFGASWMEGVASTPGANRRFPNLLNSRLSRGWVVNQGISGNRLLTDEVGEHALARFDRDVLAVPGVSHVLIQHGLNDLGFGGFGQPLPSAVALIGGFTELTDRAHAAGITVTGTTLGPMGGAIYDGYDTPEGRAIAREVDEWMRSSHVFDALTDFTRVLQDPDSPDSMRPDLDSGDHLHPNDSGYRAMANAVDLDSLGL